MCNDVDDGYIVYWSVLSALEDKLYGHKANDGDAQSYELALFKEFLRKLKQSRLKPELIVKDGDTPAFVEVMHWFRHCELSYCYVHKNRTCWKKIGSAIGLLYPVYKEEQERRNKLIAEDPTGCKLKSCTCKAKKRKRGSDGKRIDHLKSNDKFASVIQDAMSAALTATKDASERKEDGSYDVEEIKKRLHLEVTSRLGHYFHRNHSMCAPHYCSFAPSSTRPTSTKFVRAGYFVTCEAQQVEIEKIIRDNLLLNEEQADKNIQLVTKSGGLQSTNISESTIAEVSRYRDKRKNHTSSQCRARECVAVIVMNGRRMFFSDARQAALLAIGQRKVCNSRRKKPRQRGEESREADAEASSESEEESDVAALVKKPRGGGGSKSTKNSDSQYFLPFHRCMELCEKYMGYPKSSLATVCQREHEKKNLERAFEVQEKRRAHKEKKRIAKKRAVRRNMPTVYDVEHTGYLLECAVDEYEKKHLSQKLRDKLHSDLSEDLIGGQSVESDSESSQEPMRCTRCGMQGHTSLTCDLL